MGAMGLILPVDHASADTWGAILNAALGLVESHNHSPGQGNLVPTTGLNINADLSFASHAITNALALDMIPTTAATVAGFSSALWTQTSDSNLYFRNAGGTNVQITAGNTLNVAVAGAIGGDYGAVGALLDFIDANDTYHFYQQLGGGVRQYARVAHGDIDLFEYKAQPTIGVPANRVRHKSPAALAGSYDLTWLTALPAGNAVMFVDNTGAITSATSPTLINNANLTLQGTGYVKRSTRTTTVPLLGITAQVSSGSVSTTAGTPGAQMAVSTVAFFPIYLPDADSELTSITSVTLRNQFTGTGNVTLQVLQTVFSLGIFSALSAATGFAVNSSITINLTAPTVVSTGDTLWLKITTAATNSGGAEAATITSTVP